jgi:hypothetical protein
VGMVGVSIVKIVCFSVTPEVIVWSRPYSQILD